MTFSFDDTRFNGFRKVQFCWKEMVPRLQLHSSFPVNTCEFFYIITSKGRFPEVTLLLGLGKKLSMTTTCSTAWKMACSIVKPNLIARHRQ